MIFKYQLGKLFYAVVLGALLASCASGPSQSTSNPLEIAQSLGYERISAVEQVPALTTFTLESVNSRTAVMGGSFGVRYLIVFSRNCPEAGFGNIFETTATGGQLDTNDSIVIDEETYCPISEIFVLE